MKIKTEHPVAYDSPDHLCPWGTARDNSTDYGFILEIESFFNGKKIKTLDIGCSGGQLTIDFHNRGHEAIGIEGSDYSVVNQRANWPQYHNNLLFTCDATKPYEVLDEKEEKLVKFDLITAWEVVEHIHEKDFEMFFENILSHLKEDGIFCASINPYEDTRDGFDIHQSVFDQEKWYSILKKFFVVEDMPFHNKVRYGGSFHVLCRKPK